RPDPRARPALARRCAGRVRRADRPVGLRQEHAPEPRRRARPADSGSIAVGGMQLEELWDVSEYRAATVGFVFQFHNLIPTLSALENVQVPMIGRRPRGERAARASELLSDVGLLERLGSYPGTLSGGERQRGAIARSLAHQ